MASRVTRRGWENTSLWRHNGRDGVSNHQPHDCLLNRSFRRRSKKTSKLRVTGLCAGNSPVTGEFPAQMASNAENASIWWSHHENVFSIWTATTLPSQRQAQCQPKILGSTSIRYRSDTEVSERCLIDVDPMVFAVWEHADDRAKCGHYFADEIFIWVPSRHKCLGQQVYISSGIVMASSRRQAFA